MSGKTVTAREFKEACLSLIEEVDRTHETVTIMDHGRAVARLVPTVEERNSESTKRSLVIGGLKGSVLRYDDPFAPVLSYSRLGYVDAIDAAF